MPRVAVVTGANQGLGLALVKGLCERLAEDDVVYLTARDPEKGEAAVAAIGSVRPRLRFDRLDVTEEGSVAGLAEALRQRHGGVDIVISNAAARIVRDVAPAEQVQAFVETSNHGTHRVLQRFLPILRRAGRLVVVASSFGRLKHLPEHLHRRFEVDRLEDLGAVMDGYVAAVRAGTAAAEGWPEWINVASKVGQVAAARLAARTVAADRPADGILVNAVCPGLVDTDASRPWFADMSKAQSPDQAAVDVLWLATLPEGAVAPAGELVQFRKVLPWRGE